ncbi:hypothetical protein LIER_24894 [Lithospermum erythrorhizon]|uniref:Uncharacterized protein n=1 Tax=Lithospermum erythrorhizon TaxID=34254 RepID=A0AAV3R2U1_LITER
MDKDHDEERMMQFLMGLTIEYDVVRDQILMREPLPTLRKTYSGGECLRNREICIMERLRLEMLENSVMQAKVEQGKSGNQGRGNYKDYKQEKYEISLLKCEHCEMKGHSKSGCFKLIGFPQWWVGNKTAQHMGRPRQAMVHNVTFQFDEVTDTPLEVVDDFGEESGLQNMIVKLIQKEVGKALKKKNSEEIDYSDSVFSLSVNSTCFDNNGSWIVENGASTHV